MSKIILIFLIALNLYSNEIAFKESKYISALQSVITKAGTLNIDNSFILLKYPLENLEIKFGENNIIKEKDKLTQTLQYEDNIELSIFSKIIKSIFFDKSEELNEYFTLEKNKDLTTLIPNDYISNVIEKIEYKKNASKLIFLKIYFINEDWINIEQTN